MEVLINNEQTRFDVTDYEVLIQTGFEIAARLEGLEGELEVSVSFVDNEIIQELNREYRHMDAPTDVLSFPQDDDGGFLVPDAMLTILGDIVISLERAADQAEEYGHSLQREVLYLAIHGFFHLLGYDHETPEEQQVMRKLEERVLAELDLRRD